MNGKINNTLLATLRPAKTAFEVNDTDLKGFGVRIQPSGVMSYFVRYRLRGKQTRYVIGRTSEFSPAQARDAARSTLAGVNLGTNPLDDRKPVKEAKTLGKFITEDFAPWARTHRKAADANLARIRTNFDTQWDRPLSELNALGIEKWRQQPEMIELDYSMKEGKLVLNLRGAVAGYVLQQWNVDCSNDHHLDPIRFRLWLKDADKVLYQVESAVMASGYKSLSAF